MPTFPSFWEPVGGKALRQIKGTGRVIVSLECLSCGPWSSLSHSLRELKSTSEVLYYLIKWSQPSFETYPDTGTSLQGVWCLLTGCWLVAPCVLLTTCEVASFPFVALWRKHGIKYWCTCFPAWTPPRPCRLHTRTQEGAFMAKPGLTSWLLKENLLLISWVFMAVALE